MTTVFASLAAAALWCKSATLPLATLDTIHDEMIPKAMVDGAATWRRITDAVAQLANTTPPGPVH